MVPVFNVPWVHPARWKRAPRRFCLALASTFNEVRPFHFDESQVLWHSGIVATPSSVVAFVDLLTRSLAEHRRRHGGAGLEPER